MPQARFRKKRSNARSVSVASCVLRNRSVFVKLPFSVLQNALAQGGIAKGVSVNLRFKPLIFSPLFFPPLIRQHRFFELGFAWFAESQTAHTQSPKRKMGLKGG